MKNKLSKTRERNRENIKKGLKLLKSHPLFKYIDLPNIKYTDRVVLGRDGAGKVESSSGRLSYKNCIVLNDMLSLKPEEWMYVMAHLYLHLAFGHFDAEKMPGYDAAKNDAPKLIESIWNQACDICVSKFLRELKIGKPIGDDPMLCVPGSVANDERKLYQYIIKNNLSFGNASFGMAGNQMDMEGLSKPNIYGANSRKYRIDEHNEYARNFTNALAYSLNEAISIAGGHGKLD